MKLDKDWQVRLAQILLGAAIVIALVVVRGDGTREPARSAGDRLEPQASGLFRTNVPSAPCSSVVTAALCSTIGAAKCRDSGYLGRVAVAPCS